MKKAYLSPNVENIKINVIDVLSISNGLMFFEEDGSYDWGYGDDFTS